MKIDWDWSAFIISIVALSTAVVVVIPAVERIRDYVTGTFVINEDGEVE